MNKRIPLIISLCLVILSAWLAISPSPFIHNLNQRLEKLGYDIQLRTRVLTNKNKLDTPIAIVDIDNRSLAAEGRWPWSRAKLAQLIDKLQQQGAVVIAFDMLFTEPEQNIIAIIESSLKEKNLLAPDLIATLNKIKPEFNNDQLFSKAIYNNHIVLSFTFLPYAERENELPKPVLTLPPEQLNQLSLFRMDGFISSTPILQNVAAGAGFINIFPDVDGVMRHVPLIMAFENKIYPSLALQAVLTYLGQSIQLVTPFYNKTERLEGIKIGDRVIYTDETGQVYIPFIGKSYTFPYYSATDVLNGRVPDEALLGKLIFIGTSATGLGDLQATAIQSPFPGVEIQANVANGLLTNNFSFEPAWVLGAKLFLIVLFGLIGAFIFPYLGPRSLTLIIVFFPALVLFVNNWFWEKTGLIISFIQPILLILVLALFNLIYGYLSESKRRERIKEMFGQYVPEKFIDTMLKTKSNYALHGEDRDMSVLFADIRNFTSIAENLSASQLVDMLNAYFTPMTEIIFHHRGTIDKYVGDLIMAFWGAPLKDRYHARHAIESAIEMQKKLREMNNAASQTPANQPIRIGIGINTGMMSVGNMGSRYRRNYTVLGDTVNLASRIESLTKFYGVDIIVNASTCLDQKQFIFRKLDKVRVKGKDKITEIYEVIDYLTALTPQKEAELKRYHVALDAYYAQHWDIAYAEMQALAAAHPNDMVYRMYVERIALYKAHPVPSDWDGSYTHIEK